MKLDKSYSVLIVGLGLIGGSYAKGLKKEGHTVFGIDSDPETVSYALSEGIIDKGVCTPEPEMISRADLIVIALYPHLLVDWVLDNKSSFKKGAVITDVTGVKSDMVHRIQANLGRDNEFIAAHPMAGREVYGIKNSDEKIFLGANFIIVPTDENTFDAIEIIKGLANTLGFARISSMPPRAHDEMIGFVSQLTHCIAICLMTCSKSEHLVDYTGDSFRDLTRIARINEKMWSELFLLNKDALLLQMKKFIDEFSEFYDILERGDCKAMKEKMILSAKRRALFDKKPEKEGI